MIATIVIATYNEENYIEECIETLENQSFSRNKYQIFIIDGRSTDNTRQVVEGLAKKYSNLKLLDNPNKIQASAFNIGIENSNTKYTFIIGAHAYYDPNFIENSVMSIEESKVDCVGGKVKFVAKTKMGQYYATARGTLFGGGIAAYRYSNEKQLVETVSFGCYLTDTLRKVGGYKEELVKNQDNDINKRIIQQGGKLLFDPSIVFYYYTRENIKTMMKQMFNYGYWEAKVIEQDKKQFSIFTLVPSIFVIYTIVSLLLLFMNIKWPFYLWLIPYIVVFLIFYIKYGIKEKKEPFKLLFIYLLVHYSIGVGFLKGIFK